MFADRADAGRQLARRLADYARPDPLVLALPRGGLPVALPVAVALNAELDVLVVRKLGVPGNPEFAMGAIGEDGIIVMDHEIRRQLHLTTDRVNLVIDRERAEIDRRIRAYRGGSRRLGLAGRNVIIVDDGLATGSTALAAVRVARRMGVGHLTLAVPVGAPDTVHRLGETVDDLVCLSTPEPFLAVGRHYREFDQVTDEDVIEILRSRPRADPRAAHHGSGIDADVSIPVLNVVLHGHLKIPPGARGIVVFVHGSGSDQHSPRNARVARALQAAGFGTLLFDLLTAEENRPGGTISVEESADRLQAVTTWLRQCPEAEGIRVGYFGSSSGAAAALAAAAEQPDAVSAVVSRGGRPDLALQWLPSVQAPTLLIVGANDRAVLDLNHHAQRLLACPNLLEVVKGASHLFEEPGSLQQVAALAQAWYLRHL